MMRAYRINRYLRCSFVLYLIAFGVISLLNYRVLLSYGNDTNKAFFHSHDDSSKTHVLKDNSKNLLSKDDGRLRVNLCLSVPAFLEYGGIEYWIRSFAQIINQFSKNDAFRIPFRLYGMHVWDLNTDSLLEFMKKQHLEYIQDYDDLALYCDIVINTASWIVKDPSVVNIMVIHGDHNDTWTKNYAKMHQDNDFVVSVSDFHFTNKNPNTTYLHIPTMLLDRGSTCNQQYRFCKNQMLFVGRISEEKRSELACQYACSGSAGYDSCTILIGDYYFKENRPKCVCDSVYYMGFRDDVDCFMKNSDYLFVPSKSEGGPIVAIEAWQYGLPVVMKKTGLAHNYPESFIIYDWDHFDAYELHSRLSDTVGIETVKKNMKKTYEVNFSSIKIMEMWKDVFSQIMPRFEIYQNIYYVQSETTFIRVRGKQFIADCWRSECHLLIVVYSSRETLSFLVEKLQDTGLVLSISTAEKMETFSISNATQLVQFSMNPKPSTRIHIDIYSTFNHFKLYNFY